MTASGSRSGHGNALTRRVVAFIGIFSSVEAVGMFCSLVRNKLAAIWLGTYGIGLLGLYSTVIELLGTVSQLGLRTTAVRDIASSTGSRRLEFISVVTHYGRYLALFGILLTIAASPFLSLMTFGTADRFLPFLLISLAVGCNTIASSRAAVLQGENRLGNLAKATLWSAVISLAATVPMIYFWRMDSIIPILLTYSIVTMVLYLAFSRRNDSLPELKAGKRRSMASGMMKLGAFLTISGIAGWLTNYIVMSYLNHAGGESLMGCYQSGYTIIIKYIGIVFTALSLEFYPRISACAAGGTWRINLMLRHETLLSVAVVTAVSAIFIPLAPWIVSILYSDEFQAIVPMVILASPGIVLRAVSWAMAFTLLAKGRGRLYLVTELSSCLTCVILTVCGYSAWGLTGIGLMFTLWYAVYTVVVWAVTRTIGIRLGRTAWLVALSAFTVIAAMAATAIFAPFWISTTSGLIVATASAIAAVRSFA